MLRKVGMAGATVLYASYVEYRIDSISKVQFTNEGMGTCLCSWVVGVGKGREERGCDR